MVAAIPEKNPMRSLDQCRYPLHKRKMVEEGGNKSSSSTDFFSPLIFLPVYLPSFFFCVLASLGWGNNFIFAGRKTEANYLNSIFVFEVVQTLRKQFLGGG